MLCYLCYFVFFRSCEKGFCHISATTKAWNYGIIKIKQSSFKTIFLMEEGACNEKEFRIQNSGGRHSFV